MKSFALIVVLLLFLPSSRATAQPDANSIAASPLIELSAAFTALQIGILFHELGHFVGATTLTEAQFASMQWGVFGAKTMFKNTETVSGFLDAAAIYWPAHLSDMYLMKVPYRQWYRGTNGFTDRIFANLVDYSNVMPVGYATYSLVMHLFGEDGADWDWFSAVWHGFDYSYKHDLTMFAAAGVLWADFIFFRLDELKSMNGFSAKEPQDVSWNFVVGPRLVGIKGRF